MKKRFFGKNIEPACTYCSHGSLSADKSFVICYKHGAVAPYYSCRKFDYDPLRRVPAKHTKILIPEKMDFSL